MVNLVDGEGRTAMSDLARTAMAYAAFVDWYESGSLRGFKESEQPSKFLPKELYHELFEAMESALREGGFKAMREYPELRQKLRDGIDAWARDQAEKAVHTLYKDLVTKGLRAVRRMEVANGSTVDDRRQASRKVVAA